MRTPASEPSTEKAQSGKTPPSVDSSTPKRSPWKIVAAATFATVVVASVVVAVVMVVNFVALVRPEQTHAAPPTVTDEGESVVAAASAGASPGQSFPTWPSATNTGVPVGMTLRKQAGILKVTKSGTVIDGIDLAGCVSIAATHVTIKRSRIRGSCAEGTIGPAYGADMSGTLIEDVEVDGLNLSTSFSAVAGYGFTCLRCNLHSTGTGVRAGNDVTVTDSYVHGNHVGGESHNTAVSIHGGSNITLRHNYLQCDGGYNCSAALSLYTHDGPIDHVLVEQNLFSGGGYCVYAGVYTNPDHSILAATYVRFLNNGFLTNQWPKCGDLGPVAAWDAPAPGNEWSGNFWYPNRSNEVGGS